MKRGLNLIAPFILLLFCVACSGPDDGKKESASQTTTQQQVEQIGHQAAADIKGTINSAEMTRQTQEQYDQQMNEMLDDQEKSK